LFLSVQSLPVILAPDCLGASLQLLRVGGASGAPQELSVVFQDPNETGRLRPIRLFFDAQTSLEKRFSICEVLPVALERGKQPQGVGKLAVLRPINFLLDGQCSAGERLRLGWLSLVVVEMSQRIETRCQAALIPRRVFFVKGQALLVKALRFRMVASVVAKARLRVQAESHFGVPASGRLAPNRSRLVEILFGFGDSPLVMQDNA